MKNAFTIAIHGGAGTIHKSQMSDEKEAAYKAALSSALNAGYALLDKGGSALDAVERAVSEMEDSPLFNAGKGAVFTHEGTHEMDAAIMEGKTRMGGAVAGVEGVKNPIQLAKLIMEKSGHVFLAGKGALAFAKENNVQLEAAEYFHDDLRYKQWQEALKNDVVQLDHSPLNEKKFGTVGAVALDQEGNIAAATSTGGMTNKRFGRVGDSPMLGAGNYANNQTCAVSCTGSGEFFIRGVVAYDVSCLMEFKGLSLQDACSEVIQKRLFELGGDGGLIAADSKGNLCLEFNTDGMYRGMKKSDGTEEISIYK
ncbi:MAG: beta-aspartyl-peptidase (threonine type) [Flavobacteriales bacterium]|jgi:beta-aspartyl-peptidase (threonine type)